MEVNHIQGTMILDQAIYKDDRGYFREIYKESKFYLNFIPGIFFSGRFTGFPYLGKFLIYRTGINLEFLPLNDQRKKEP